MTRIVFDDVDRLILGKWLEVSELVAAFEAVQDKLREQLASINEGLQAWAQEQDLELTVKPKEGEFWAYQRDWLQPSRDQPWVSLVVGGFVIEDAAHDGGNRVYSAIYCTSGKHRQFSKDVFGAALKAAIGAETAALWSVDTDRGCPLNRYSASLSPETFLDSERLGKLVAAEFNQLLEFVEPVASSIHKALQKA
jgi:hypothetical protein